jgi:hypothetical protein
LISKNFFSVRKNVAIQAAHVKRRQPLAIRFKKAHEPGKLALTNIMLRDRVPGLKSFAHFLWITL